MSLIGFRKSVLGLVLIAAALLVFNLSMVKQDTKECEDLNVSAKRMLNQFGSPDFYTKTYNTLSANHSCNPHHNVLGINNDSAKAKEEKIKYYGLMSEFAHSLGKYDESKNYAKTGLSIANSMNKKDQQNLDNKQIISRLKEVENGTP